MPVTNVGGLRAFIAGGRRTAEQEIRVDLQQAGRRQILAGFHVVDAPDDEVTRRGIDVEDVGPGLDLADARNLGAINMRNLRAGQPCGDGMGDRLGIRRACEARRRAGGEARQCGKAKEFETCHGKHSLSCG